MLFNRAQSGRIEYGIREFYIDTPDDFDTLLETDCKPGSAVKVISTGDTYIKNSQGQWVKQPAGGSSSGDGSGTTIDSAIWDGGLIQ